MQFGQSVRGIGSPQPLPSSVLPIWSDVTGGTVSGGLVVVSVVLVEISGGLVEVSGGLVEVSGAWVEVSGRLVVVSGFSVDVCGLLVKVSGELVEVTGGSAEVSGTVVVVSGFSDVAGDVVSEIVAVVSVFCPSRSFEVQATIHAIISRAIAITRILRFIVQPFFNLTCALAPFLPTL